MAVRKRKLWLDPNEIPLTYVVLTFLSEYPLIDQSKLNGQTMRAILAGDLHIVKMGRTQKFELWDNHQFGLRLKAWNNKQTPANKSKRIPPIRPLSPDKVEKMKEVFKITDFLELVSLTPREF
jgi:hypothetical protein